MIKKVSLIALLLLAIGVVGSIVTYSSYNKSSSNDALYIQSGNISSIQIDVDNADIEFIPVQHTEETKFELISENGETLQEDFTFKEENDTLTIIQQSANNRWFSFSINTTPLTLKIYAPEQIYENFSINGDSSDLYLSNFEAKSVNLSTDSGDITAENIVSESITLKTDSGDVDLFGIEGEIQTKTDSGDVTFTLTEVTGKLQINTDSGDVDLSLNETSNNIQIATDSGDIGISTKEPSDVTFDVDTDSGDINLFDKYNKNAKIGKGTLLFQLKTDSGDIAVTDY